MENLLLGFATATTITNLALCLLGVTLGTLIGVLPGLGPMATISLLLPLTYGVGDPTGSIIFLAGIFYGSQYGGSITAILLRIPGEASSTVTVIDGYAMTRRGRGGAALTITALASFVGGTVAAIIMALLARPLSELAFFFGPAEYATLMLLGVMACVSVNQNGFFKGSIMILLGGFLGLVGTNIATGETRFTAGIIYLNDGISFVALVVGVFGLGEIFYNTLRSGSMPATFEKIISLYPTRQELKESILPTARGSLLGTLLGLLPGGGAILSSFLGYALEKKLSKNPREFGRGAVAGIASPEAANNASAQSQFLPTLMLGLPFTPVMALITVALIINGVQPGPSVLNTNPALFWAIIVSMWIGNLILIVLNIPLVRIWASVLLVPRWILYPIVMTVSVIGVYSINNSWFDILLLIIFGMLGLALKIAKIEAAPMALTFIIAPMFEEYFFRALTISQGDWMIFLEKPIALTFLVITAIMILFSLFQKKDSNGK